MVVHVSLGPLNKIDAWSIILMAILMAFLCNYNEYIVNNDFQSVYYAKAIIRIQKTSHINHVYYTYMVSLTFIIFRKDILYKWIFCVSWNKVMMQRRKCDCHNDIFIWGWSIHVKGSYKHTLNTHYEVRLSQKWQKPTWNV